MGTSFSATANTESEIGQVSTKGSGMTDDESVLMTVAETARLLERSTEQVRRYLREGTLSGQRLGGQWFVRRTDADAFLTRRHAGSVFLRELRTSDPDPLAAVIALGGSGGAAIATGKIKYVRSLRWER